MTAESQASSLTGFHPTLCAQFPHLFKGGVSVEELATVGLFDPTPKLGPQFLKGGFPGLFAFLEQPQAFANDFARGLITPRGDARFNELFELRGERHVHADANRHTFIDATEKRLCQFVSHPRPAPSPLASFAVGAAPG